MGQSLGCCLGSHDGDATKPAAKDGTRSSRAYTMSMDSDAGRQAAGECVVQTARSTSMQLLVDEGCQTSEIDPTEGAQSPWARPGHVRRASHDTVDLDATHGVTPEQDDDDNRSNNYEGDGLLPLLAVKRPPALTMSLVATTQWETRSLDEHSLDGSTSGWDSDPPSNQDPESPARYTVSVNRYYPLEDKFEFSVTVFDGSHGGRRHVLVRDHARCEKYHDYLLEVAASHNVGCPALPRTKKLDRTHGRQLMEIYVAAVLASPVLRDATCSLKYFHVVPPAKRKAAATPVLSDKRQPWRTYAHSPSRR
ncbi:hypothetical protein ACHHYP_02075 [Achlya hypogyna]|uniref:PX domain-containing protein n=1 Tax=Achlya hypogyna TaxID=1202772 RepID=A0A1V9ZSL8_ACHHY|nr:hypothetical protein ACHHYP_02075 [Achlya hypogyna]